MGIERQPDLVVRTQFFRSRCTPISLTYFVSGSLGLESLRSDREKTMYRLLDSVSRIIDEIQRQSRACQRTDPQASELLYQASLGLDDAHQMLQRAHQAQSLSMGLDYLNEARNLLYAEQRHATPQGQYGQLPRDVCHWLEGRFATLGAALNGLLQFQAERIEQERQKKQEAHESQQNG